VPSATHAIRGRGGVGRVWSSHRRSAHGDSRSSFARFAPAAAGTTFIASPARPLALSRWTIERIFEDAKDELGMDHFEVRRFRAIRRHLLPSCLSHTFLAEFRLNHGGKTRP